MELSEAVFSFDYDGDDFTINQGEKVLRGCKWVASDLPPEFCVVFVHDFFSFGSQNHDFFDVLTSRGAVVYACDHLGHGRSPGKRIMLEINDVCEETLKVIQLAKTENPTLPLYILAQNGGALSIIYGFLTNNEFKSNNLVKGVILESPWVCSWQQKQFGIFETVFLILMNKLCPSFLLDTGFSFFTDKNPEHFVKMSTDCALYFPYITPKLYLSVMDAITLVREKASEWPKVPTMFAIGDHETVLQIDQLNQFLASFEKTKHMQIKRYDCGHMISKEESRAEYMQDIFDFVQKYRK